MTVIKSKNMSKTRQKYDFGMEPKVTLLYIFFRFPFI